MTVIRAGCLGSCAWKGIFALKIKYFYPFTVRAGNYNRCYFLKPGIYPKELATVCHALRQGSLLLQ